MSVLTEILISSLFSLLLSSENIDGVPQAEANKIQITVSALNDSTSYHCGVYQMKKE